MEHTKISADKVRIGQMRYFDMERNGTEIPEDKAYAFLVNIGGVYINPFDPLEEIPVYDRGREENYTLDGEPYGTKIKLVSGEVKEGLCYVLEKADGREIFDKEEVTMQDLVNYMLSSKDFFFDRINIDRDGHWNYRNSWNYGYNYRYTPELMRDDRIKRMNLFKYLNRKEKTLVKTK